MDSAAHWPLWAVALQDSAPALVIRHSMWIYPAANVVHVLGVALFVGAIVAYDLRLLGVGRRLITAEAASRWLTPLMVVGFLMIVPAGLTLFTADAGPLAANRILQTKLAIVALGVVNAVIFRLAWSGRLKRWDRNTPAAGRLQAALSILIWLSVPTLGRLIAYL